MWYPDWWPSSLCLNPIHDGKSPIVDLQVCRLSDKFLTHTPTAWWIKEHRFQKYCFISFRGLLYQVTTNRVALKQQSFLLSQFWRLKTRDQGVDRTGSFWNFQGELVLASPRAPGSCWPPRVLCGPQHHHPYLCPGRLVGLLFICLFPVFMCPNISLFSSAH